LKFEREEARFLAAYSMKIVTNNLLETAGSLGILCSILTSRIPPGFANKE